MSVTNISKGVKELNVKELSDEDFESTSINHFLTISTLCNDNGITDSGELTGNATDKAI